VRTSKKSVRVERWRNLWNGAHPRDHEAGPGRKKKAVVTKALRLYDRYFQKYGAKVWEKMIYPRCLPKNLKGSQETKEKARLRAAVRARRRRRKYSAICKGLSPRR
jgi:hypothetical protein